MGVTNNLCIEHDHPALHIYLITEAENGRKNHEQILEAGFSARTLLTRRLAVNHRLNNLRLSGSAAHQSGYSSIRTLPRWCAALPESAGVSPAGCNGGYKR